MSRPEPSIVGEAGAAAIAAARESLGDDLRTVAEYDADDYNLIYIAAWLRDRLGEEGVEETARQLHGYVHLDFVERDLFGDLTPVAGEVRTNITRLEHATFVRYLVGDAGIFLSVDPDADLTALCEAMDAALEATGEA
jgi:hypothetical protein